jgi:hypothetical protein
VFGIGSSVDHGDVFLRCLQQHFNTLGRSFDKEMPQA